MVALEAWALGKPVLANGRCDVLKGQCLRSNAGLYYESYAEFAETLYAIASNASLAQRALGPQRPRSTSAALRLAGDRAQVPRHVRAAVDEGRVRPRRAIEPLPGWFARSGAHGCRRPRTSLAARARQGRGQAHERRLRVHQVLATLGYGDAIGHEVLGIQRVLRARRLRLGDLRRDRGPAARALTRDYRELVDASHPDNLLLHHFSIGSRASRTAYALPDRMALIYHNITPPEYFVGVHRRWCELCFRGRRELRPTSTAATSRSATRSSTARSSRRSAFRARRSCRSCPTSRTSTATPDSHVAGAVRRRLDERPVRRAASSRTRRSRM